MKAGLTVTSTGFGHNETIPRKYTCEGDDINPPLAITGAPDETQSLAIIVEDPDAVHPGFIHWLAWNIPPHKPIAEDSNPGINGRNGFGKTGYGGPCPPSGLHRYYFKVYALDITLNLPSGSDKDVLQRAMEGHILASGELTGRYQKAKKG